jgi:hypothetical protein
MPSKRIGRPPLDTESPSVRVNVRVTERQYDELWATAERDGLTVPEVIRRLARLVPKDPKA